MIKLNSLNKICCSSVEFPTTINVNDTECNFNYLTGYSFKVDTVMNAQITVQDNGNGTKQLNLFGTIELPQIKINYIVPGIKELYEDTSQLYQYKFIENMEHTRIFTAREIYYTPSITKDSSGNYIAPEKTVEEVEDGIKVTVEIPNGTIYENTAQYGSVVTYKVNIPASTCRSTMNIDFYPNSECLYLYKTTEKDNGMQSIYDNFSSNFTYTVNGYSNVQSDYDENGKLKITKVLLGERLGTDTSRISYSIVPNNYFSVILKDDNGSLYPSS